MKLTREPVGKKNDYSFKLSLPSSPGGLKNPIDIAITVSKTHKPERLKDSLREEIGNDCYSPVKKIKKLEKKESKLKAVLEILSLSFSSRCCIK